MKKTTKPPAALPPPKPWCPGQPAHPKKGLARWAGRWGLLLALALGQAARAQQPAAPGPTRPAEDIFIKAVCSSPTAYAGQALAVSYLLYYHIPVIDPDTEIELRFKNCFVEEYPPTHQERTETVGGKRYQVRVLRKYLVVPELAGTLSMPVLKQRYSLKDTPSPEDFFGEQRMVSKAVRSVVGLVPVRALPAPSDSAAFSRAVGQFRFRSSYTVSKKSANLLTVQLKITGKGDLRKTQLLPPLLPGGLDVFNSAGAEKHALTAKGLTAEYTFSYDVLANYQGTYALPGIKVLTFNPDKGQYEAYAAPAFTWRVAEGPLAPMQPVARQQPGRKAGPALYAKSSLYQDQDKQLFIGSRRYYGLLLVAGLFFLTGLVQAQRLKGRAANPRLYLARQAKTRAIKALSRMDSDSAQPLDAFCKRLSGIMVNYLCAKLYLQENDFFLRDLLAVLHANEVPAPLASQTAQVLGALTKIRFSAAPVTTKSRGFYTEEIREIITELDACIHDKMPHKLVPALR